MTVFPVSLVPFDRTVASLPSSEYRSLSSSLVVIVNIQQVMSLNNSRSLPSRRHRRPTVAALSAPSVPRIVAHRPVGSHRSSLLRGPSIVVPPVRPLIV